MQQLHAGTVVRKLRRERKRRAAWHLIAAILVLVFVVVLASSGGEKSNSSPEVTIIYSNHDNDVPVAVFISVKSIEILCTPTKSADGGTYTCEHIREEEVKYDAAGQP